MINALQCFGKSNKEEEVRILASVNECRGRVFEQLALSPRRLIIAMGKWANISLTGNQEFKITQTRGEFYKLRDPLRGIMYDVLPTLHPAALLRGQGNIAHYKADLIRAVEFALEVPSSTWKDPKVVQLGDANSIRSIHNYILELHDYHKAPIIINADYETSGLVWHKYEPLCLGFYIDATQDDSDTAYVIDWDRIRKEMRVPLSDDGAYDFYYHEELARQRYPIYFAVKALFELLPEIAQYCWQNGKFDAKFGRRAGIHIRVDEDTFLLDVCLDERPGAHDLDSIAKNKLGVPNHKDMLKQWVPKKSDSYSKVPKPVLWKYLGLDLKKTSLVRKLLRDEVDENPDSAKQYHKTMIPASELLTRIEMRGIHIDADVRPFETTDIKGNPIIHEGTFVTLNQFEFGRDLELAQNEVSELAGYWVNPNSPQQVKELLYGKLGLKLKGKTPKDTTKETLDKLPAHPVVKAIRKYRRIAKVLGTYINTIDKHIAADGRIHSTYNLGGARTGRLASSEPNVQNIPREGRIRRMYCAPPRRELTEGDYNTAELRMLAALSKDKFLTAVFLDDTRNLHDEVSVAMYGPDWTADQRIRAKAINFGIPYGREAFSIAEEFDITNNEAQRLIDSWLARAPEAAAFLERCKAAPSKGQTLISAFGRKCRPGVVSQEMLHAMQNEFRNFFMQSTISDFDLHAAMEMEDDLAKLDAFIINPVHDSLLVENPPEARSEVVKVMRHYMESVPRKWITTPIVFSVDFKHGQHWGLLKGR